MILRIFIKRLLKLKLNGTLPRSPLITFSSLIDVLCDVYRIRVNIIGLAADMKICRDISEQTKGTLSFSHSLFLLDSHLTPPSMILRHLSSSPRRPRIPRSPLRIRFPSPNPRTIQISPPRWSLPRPSNLFIRSHANGFPDSRTLDVSRHLWVPWKIESFGVQLSEV